MSAEPRDPSGAAPASPEIPAPGPVERSISPVSGRQSSAMAGKAFTVAALVVGCGLFLAATWTSERPKPAKTPVQPAKQVVAYEPAKPTLATPGPDAPVLNASPPAVPGDPTTVPAIDGAAAGAAAEGTAQASGQTGQDQAQTRVQAAQARVAQARAAQVAAMRAAPIVAYAARGDGAQSPGLGPVQIARAADAPTELDQMRRGSSIGRVAAKPLGDRNFLILAGAALPCVLQTAMDSATPGYVTCVTPSDVYSDNGAVVLLEKGTKVLGEYRSGQRQGQRRLFVLWTRAVTPNGVAIALASPASDALGRAGFDGDLDTHFWDRFGGALLLSIVDEAAYGLDGRGGQPGVARAPSDAASVALQSSVNIAPSLRKAQGAEVAILVAQDFDFSAVYGLKAR